MRNNLEGANEAYDRLLHNTGGPRSRSRTEYVQSSMLKAVQTSALKTEKLYSRELLISLIIPDEVTEPEEWLHEILIDEGFASWEELEWVSGVPPFKMLVYPTNEYKTKMPDRLDMLYAALLLSRSNDYRYLPDGPKIFTRRRLNRSVKLFQIDQNKYYELG